MNRKEVVDCPTHSWRLAEPIEQTEAGLMLKADCGCMIGPVVLWVEVSPGVMRRAKYKFEKEEVKR